MDEPWIMTVKGIHSIKPPPEENNHRLNGNHHRNDRSPGPVSQCIFTLQITVQIVPCVCNE